MACEIRFKELQTNHAKHCDPGSIKHSNVDFKIELLLISAIHQQFMLNYSCLKNIDGDIMCEY